MSAVLPALAGLMVGVSLGFLLGVAWLAISTSRKLADSGVVFDADEDRWIFVGARERQATP